MSELFLFVEIDVLPSTAKRLSVIGRLNFRRTVALHQIIHVNNNYMHYFNHFQCIAR